MAPIGGIQPYYEDDHVTLYHGDCLDLLDGIEADVLVTDPPYGINLATDYSGLRGSTRNYDPVHGDAEPFDPAHILDLGLPTLLFGVDHYMSRLPGGGTLHVWDKRVDAKSNMFADFEAVWTSWASGPSRLLRYQWVAGSHPGARREQFPHPTVKPVDLMRMLIEMCPPGVILDPFAGSGSTLRAAKDLGRKAIGIEIEERYCEVIVKRLAQEVLL